jgi:hypothetical protein
MPPSLEHFQWTSKDIKKANSVEELFKNKISEKLGLMTINDEGNPYPIPKKSLTLDNLVSLSRPLDLNNPNDLGMIDRLRGDIPDGYKGSEWAEKYRGALINGKTRKNFNNWLMKNSGISVPERIGNKFRNIWYYILQIGSWFGIDSAKEALEKLKEERAQDDDPEKSPNNAKINKALKTKKEKVDQNKQRKKWNSAENIALKTEFEAFYADNKDLLYFTTDVALSSDFNNILGLVSPAEFQKWNTADMQKILKWAKEDSLASGKEKISRKNWDVLVAKQSSITITADKKLKLTKQSIKGHSKSIPIDTWNNENIEKFDESNSPRMKKFDELKKEGIFADDLDVGTFLTEFEDDLFTEPENAENRNLKPFFESLFSLGKSYYGEGDNSFKLSADDIRTIISNKSKLNGELDCKIDATGGWLNAKDNDYWTIHEGKLSEVVDGHLKNDANKEIHNGDRINTFEVDMAGENSGNIFDPNQDFDSVQALIEKLKK